MEGSLFVKVFCGALTGKQIVVTLIQRGKFPEVTVFETTPQSDRMCVCCRLEGNGKGRCEAKDRDDDSDEDEDEQMDVTDEEKCKYMCGCFTPTRHPRIEGGVPESFCWELTLATSVLNGGPWGGLTVQEASSIWNLWKKMLYSSNLNHLYK